MIAKLKLATFFRLSSIILIAFSFFHPISVIAYGDSLNIKLPNTRKVDRDPRALVNLLTEGKNTEKEKFDVIFLWVAQNIKYNYKKFNTSRGHHLNSIKHVLSTKVGLCLDYANLMDTLCFLAGITNVSVYGYARDYLFDVNDSLFMDNHAWNAVMLNNLWYVYDVTWASGGYNYELTKCSQRRYEWMEKLYQKTKVKHIKFRLKNKFKCKDLEKKESYNYIRLKFFPKLILKILLKFDFKVRPVPDLQVDMRYYLSNPEFFSITHIPDVPYWSLCKFPPEIRAIEIDSAFYHYNLSDLPKHKSEGKFCDDCNKFLTLKEVEQFHEVKKRSFDFNRRNRFVTSLYNYKIARLNFSEALQEKDSAGKIAFIETSLLYIGLDKIELSNCVKNLRIEYNLQKKKNNRKKNFLLEENKIHTNKIQTAIKLTRKGYTGLSYFKVQFKSKIRSYNSLKQHILKRKYRLGTGTTNEDRRKKQIEKALNTSLMATRAVDSLNAFINITQKQFDLALRTLTTQAWLKIHDEDSVVKAFNHCAIYRLMIYDSFKKKMVEKRKELFRLEQKYYNDISDNIYQWSDSVQISGKLLMKQIDLRNRKLMEIAQANKKLTELSYITKTQLINKIDSLILEIELNRCTYVSWFLNLDAANSALQIHKSIQKRIARAILRENKFEGIRFHDVNKEINWRLKKYSTIPRNNMLVANEFQKHVKKYRKDYLKSLKKIHQKKK